MFIISSLAVLILAFAAVYFITADLVRPLRKMVAATQSFSKGDFTVRVPVESYDEIGQAGDGLQQHGGPRWPSSEAARRSFTANVSHELTHADDEHRGLHRRHPGRHHPAGEAGRHYLTIVSDEVKRLSRHGALDAQHRHASRQARLELRPDRLRRERGGAVQHRLHL